jgi:hypothetical protein
MQADESREPARIATWSDTVGYNPVSNFDPPWGRISSRRYSRQYDLPDREPTHARVDGVDLVEIRDDDAVSVLKVMAMACGHDSLAGFERRDLTTWKRDVAELTGVEYAGVGRESRDTGI